MFDLDYLRDNGTLRNWPTLEEPGCRLVRWADDGDYSVLAADGKPLGWGETESDAVDSARCYLTERRRKADGVVPARVR
jgi:hypothetical protein